MPSLPERPRPAQEALLRLEKGTASPNVQLNEAAQIIGLDLSLCASHPEINRAPHVPIHAAPKEEWVLRWLLKKLKGGKNYRVEPGSFLLLRQLIDLISPKQLASTLKDQKFLGIIDQTVTDLTDNVITSLRDDQYELQLSDSETSLTLSESSPARDGSSRKGTKRKRANGVDPDAMSIDEQPRTPGSCFMAFTRLLDCLYSLVRLANRTAGVDEGARSHLRHALRGESQPIAVTLGKSFALASLAVSQFYSGRKTTELQHLFYVLPALFEVWEWRSHRQDGSGQGSSNEFFAAICSQRALRLLHAVRAAQLDTDERAHVLHGIERLVALHVVLPARADFSSRGGSGIDYSASEPDWSSVKPVSDTLRPILCAEETLTQTGDGNAQKQPWNTSELIPEFFDLASRSVPRDSFRRKTEEAPWLETLFVAAAELAFFSVKSKNTATFVPEFVVILERLFRVALKQNVQLSLHTLLTHAAYTGLLKDQLSQVEWNLVALLIELGVDIFLPNSGLADSEKYLGALLGKVLLHWRSGAPTDGTYEIIKTGIILPLLRGFIGARDLATFMEIWYQQLTDVEEARAQDDKLSLFTVWEDDDVCSAYGELMRNPLNQNLASAQLRAAANEIRGVGGNIAQTASAYAQVLIVECGFRKRAANLNDDNADLGSAIQTIVSALSSDQAVHWRWRMWKLSRSLIENNVQKADAGFGSALTKLTGVAAKSIKRRHQDVKDKLSARLECIEAYQFILTVVKHIPTPDNINDLSSLTKEVTKLMKSTSEKDAVKLMDHAWDGRLESLESPTVLSLAYFLSLIRIPDIWIRLEPAVRRPLFSHVLSMAVAQHQSSSSTLEDFSSGARFLQVWASVVSHEYLLNAPIIVNDLIAVLSERVKEDESNRKLYIESLQRMPASLITRNQRGALLDLLQNVLSEKSSSSVNTVGILSLMAKLAGLPKSPAQLTSDWEPTWAIAKALSLQGTDVDLKIMKAFRFLHRAIIAKLLLLAEEDRRKQFKKMYRKIAGKVSKLQSIDCSSMECFYFRISLYQLWINREKLADAIDAKELAASRERVFELVVADLRSAKDQCKKQPLEETISVIKTLDALEDFEDLATNHAEVKKFLSKIESYVEKSVDSGSCLRRLIRRRVLATQGPEENVTAPVVEYAESIPLRTMYSEEQQLFIRAMSERFRAMSPNALTRVLQDVRQFGFDGKNAQYHFLIAGLAVAAAPPIEDKDSLQAKELSLVCTAITEALPLSKSLEEFVLATECLDVLIRSHSRCITQYNVDSILSCIAVCASKAGPRITPDASGTIYIRLCQLMGLLLGLHRQKMGGRFHLILLALQRLLQCLFARPKKRSRLAKADSEHGKQPYWLSQLDATHATYFTRLLTSLCDPTVSAVSRPTPGAGGYEGLMDQTKKAKQIAGQYLQYLVMEYAQSSLRSALHPDVKAALMPGLYSVLDVISRDTMRAMNAGLDISGRAMFKGLYDDYMKFGKWNKG